MWTSLTKSHREVISHSGKVVPECIKGDSRSQWKSGKFDPRSPKKTLNRSSPKFAWVIMSGTPTRTQNFRTIRLPPFVPQMYENSHEVTRLVFFGLFRQRTAKSPAPIITINTSMDQISAQNGLNNGEAHLQTTLNRNRSPRKVVWCIDKSGSGNPNIGSPAIPYLQVVRGSRDLLLEFWEWDPVHISGTVEARNFKFDTRIDHEGY